MKNIITSLLVLFPIVCFSQVINDTLFLVNNADSKIYVERNLKSKQFSYLQDFSKFRNIKVFNKNLPNQFLPLFVIKNKYYLSFPCDSNIPRVLMTKDSIYYENGEIIASKISSLKKVGHKTYKYLETDFLQQETIVIIKKINSKRGIYVFQKIDKEKNVEYRLLVDSKKAEGIPIIINMCLKNRTKEFDFDKIEFRNLLK
jgi:hypothetical protein